MATSPRWLPLLVLGLLVGLPGSLASIGAEIFTDSRNGGGIGRRRLREGLPPANETASSSMAARFVRPPTTHNGWPRTNLGRWIFTRTMPGFDLFTVGSSVSGGPRRLIRNNGLSFPLLFTPFAFLETLNRSHQSNQINKSRRHGLLPLESVS